MKDVCEPFRFCSFFQFIFKVKTMSSLSLAWVGDASGVSLSPEMEKKMKQKTRVNCSRLPGAAGVDNVSGAPVHGALRPVQPLQEVRNT